MGLPVLWVLTHDSVAARRGRPDAPADRALRRAARDPAPVGDPPGRRERDGRGLAGRARTRATDRWRCCSRARTCRCSTATASAAAEELERGGYVLWDSGGEPGTRRGARGDPDRDRGRGGADARGGPQARRARGSRRGWSRCPAWSCSKPSGGVPRTGPAPAVTARLAVEPGATLGWWKWVGEQGDVLGLDRFGASAPGRPCSRSSASVSRTSSLGRGRCSSEREPAS